MMQLPANGGTNWLGQSQRDNTLEEYETKLLTDTRETPLPSGVLGAREPNVDSRRSHLTRFLPILIEGPINIVSIKVPQVMLGEVQFIWVASDLAKKENMTMPVLFEV